MVGRQSFPFGTRPIFRGYLRFKECMTFHWILLHNWVVCHPLHILNNQRPFFHCPIRVWLANIMTFSTFPNLQVMWCVYCIVGYSGISLQNCGENTLKNLKTPPKKEQIQALIFSRHYFLPKQILPTKNITNQLFHLLKLAELFFPGSASPSNKWVWVTNWKKIRSAYMMSLRIGSTDFSGSFNRFLFVKKVGGT